MVCDQNNERFQVDPVFGRKLDKPMDISALMIEITPDQLTTTGKKSSIFQEVKSLGQFIKAEQVVSKTDNHVPPAFPSSDDDIEIIYGMTSSNSSRSVVLPTPSSLPRFDISRLVASPYSTITHFDSPSADAARTVDTPRNLTNTIGSPSLEVENFHTPRYITNIIGSPSVEVATVQTLI